MDHRKQAVPAFFVVIVLVIASMLVLGGAGSAKAAPGGKPSPSPSPSPTSTQPPPGGAKWTIMVYCDGDNNLESYLVSDIDNEFSLLGSNADVSVVVLADRAPGYSSADGDWTGTKVFYCTQGMKGTADKAVADWGERNMGDPQTLTDFVKYAKTNYPASHYCLAMWDHGYTWWPDYTMWDDTSADGLTLDQMTTAMTAAGPVDVVAWDCCACSSAEVCNQWRPLAQYSVGSEDLTMAEGVAWESVIPALRAAPTMTAATLANTIGKYMNDGTTSAIALDTRWDTLRSAVDQWAVALLSGLTVNRPAYDAARKVTKYFAADTTCVDLYGAAQNIQSRVTDPTIKTACQNVMNAVKGCVTYESHKTKFAGANGLTVFWPKTQANLTATNYGPYVGWTFYRNNLTWSAQTNWDEFLAAYVQ